MAPDVMWGTDGIRIETVEDGWIWVFSAADHFNAKCVGWHAAKIGNRFAALDPIAQGIACHFGSTGAGAVRGLSLRFDHGTQYMADHFLNQIRFWGIAPSPAFVAEPQTNGVAERFNRTLKEPAIHGRIFRSLDEVVRLSAISSSGNWASCHPGKPVRQPFSKRPPDAQIRVQTTGAGTHSPTGRLVSCYPSLVQNRL